MRSLLFCLLFASACPQTGVETGATEDDDDDDDDSPCEERSWYEDNDGDGFGVESTKVLDCDRPNDHVETSGDCDDDDEDVHPDAVEVCDNDDVDEDCDGEVNDADSSVDDLDTYYRDDDGDGYGDSSVTACEMPAGYSNRSGDCEDQNVSVNPGEAEICGDGIDQDCDDGGKDCRFDGDVETTDADVLMVGGDSNVLAGGLLAGADINGDGQGDLVVGTYRVGGDYTHGFYVLPGPLSSGTIDGAAATVAGVTADTTEYSLSAIVAFDVDDDGIAEVTAGLYPEGQGGKVAIFGLASGGNFTLDGAPIQFDGSEADDRFGDSLAGGDFAGSGSAGIAIGAPAWQGTGAVWVVSGPLTVATTLADASRILGDEPEGMTGSDLANLGDTDGDGLDDLAVASNEDRCSSYPCGVFHIFEGPIDGDRDLSDADASFETYLWSLSPHAVRAAGDVDGDGVADVWFADDTATENGHQECLLGAAFLFHAAFNGSSSIEDADAIIYGSSCHAKLSAGISTGTDLDEDGHADISLGTDDYSSDVNYAYLFYGPASGQSHADDADIIVTASSDNADAFADQFLLTDVIDDEAADLVIGSRYWSEGELAEGAIHVFAGAKLE